MCMYKYVYMRVCSRTCAYILIKLCMYIYMPRICICM